MKRPTKIYALRLEGVKYYVGETDFFMRRLKEHQDGTASAWTALHKVVEVEEVTIKKTKHDENNLTKDYMAKYGIDNVRGGLYTSLILSPEERAILQKEIWGAEGLCYGCGEAGHFLRSCPAGPRGDTPMPILDYQPESPPPDNFHSPQLETRKVDPSTTLHTSVNKCRECGEEFMVEPKNKSWKVLCYNCWKKGK